MRFFDEIRVPPSESSSAKAQDLSPLFEIRDLRLRDRHLRAELIALHSQNALTEWRRVLDPWS